MAAKLTEIREALVTTVASITTSNGYSTEMVPDLIFANKEDITAPNVTPDCYPKCLIVLENEEYDYEASRRLIKQAMWDVTFVVLETEDEYEDVVTTVEQTENLIDDFEKVIRLNLQLGGLARTINIKEVYTDSGYTHPEGIVIFKVIVEYEKHLT